MNRKLAWIDPHDPLPATDQALTLDEGANGLLAAGADLSAARLIEAYGRGIFPWFSRGEPVLWWTPSPRMVLMLDEFKISKSFRKTIQQALHDDTLSIRCDHDFIGVMQACAEPREDNAGTWISGPMMDAYGDLHRMGYAHSVEVFRLDGRVGGLYCVTLGKMVFGESMFSREPNASKLALAALVAWLKRHKGRVIDCQQRTQHLESLGGREIDRKEFEQHVSELAQAQQLPWVTAPVDKGELRGLLK